MRLRSWGSHVASLDQDPGGHRGPRIAFRAGKDGEGRTSSAASRRLTRQAHTIAPEVIGHVLAEAGMPTRQPSASRQSAMAVIQCCPLVSLAYHSHGAVARADEEHHGGVLERGRDRLGDVPPTHGDLLPIERVIPPISAATRILDTADKGRFCGIRSRESAPRTRSWRQCPLRHAADPNSDLALMPLCHAAGRSSSTRSPPCSGCWRSSRRFRGIDGPRAARYR
jgi:hypothetical protein